MRKIVNTTRRSNIESRGTFNSGTIVESIQVRSSVAHVVVAVLSDNARSSDSVTLTWILTRGILHKQKHEGLEALLILCDIGLVAKNSKALF